MPGWRWQGSASISTIRFPKRCGPSTVWTTGRISLDPGATRIIPGAAEMLFQIRDEDAGRDPHGLEDLSAPHGQPMSARAGPLHALLSSSIRTGAPALMDDASFQDAIVDGEHRPSPAANRSACRAAPATMPRFSPPSCPQAMLFVPSIGGISHHWTENTDDADIVTGAEVFVDTCRRLLAR